MKTDLNTLEFSIEKLELKEPDILVFNLPANISPENVRLISENIIKTTNQLCINNKKIILVDPITLTLKEN